MPVCSVLGCSNRSGRKSVKQKILEKDKKITFHEIPKNLERKNAWLKAIGRKGWVPTRRSSLCSDHFTEESFDRTSLCYVRLRESAVPSIFKSVDTVSILNKENQQNISLIMNSKVYKWCAVPLCRNTSIVAPNKLFVYVPNKKIIRDKWLKLARRDPAEVVTNSSIYFCEDHFDLPNDMENYMQYHLMGSVSQVRMKPGCIPKKFTCQPDIKIQTSDFIERPYIRKKRKTVALKECKKQFEESSKVTEQFNFEKIASESSVQHNLEVQQVTSNIIDKSIQVQTKRFRSKANQIGVRLVNQMTTPLKTHLPSISTSPFFINHSVNNNPSRFSDSTTLELSNASNTSQEEMSDDAECSKPEPIVFVECKISDSSRFFNEAN